MDYGFQLLDSGFFMSGTWTPDSNRQRDSGLLELYSEIPSSGFWIPEAKFPGFRNPDCLRWDDKSVTTSFPGCVGENPGNVVESVSPQFTFYLLTDEPAKMEDLQKVQNTGIGIKLVYILSYSRFIYTYGCFKVVFGPVKRPHLKDCLQLVSTTILDKSPWDRTAVFIFSCHFLVPS